MFGSKFSILHALRWVYKPLRWTNKTVGFKMKPSWCRLKSHVTTYLLSEKPAQVCMSLKHDVGVEVFDLKCVEMGVQVIEMD